MTIEIKQLLDVAHRCFSFQGKRMEVFTNYWQHPDGTGEHELWITLDRVRVVRKNRVRLQKTKPGRTQNNTLLIEALGELMAAGLSKANEDLHQHVAIENIAKLPSSYANVINPPIQLYPAT